MPTKPKFKHFPNRPAKLTAEFAKAEYQKLLDRVPEAEASESPAKWLKLFADWNELQSYEDSEASRIYFKYSCHMDDTELAKAEEYIREKLNPATQKPSHQLILAYLASRHRGALEAKYGKQLTEVFQTLLMPLDPINTKLRVEENRLNTEYEKLKASATVKVQGKSMTLSEAGVLTLSPDESIRKEAWLANRKWYLSHRDKMAAIYSKMVNLRTKMAANLDYTDFIPLAYEERGRQSYGRKDVDKFRKNVYKYIVPLDQKLADQHAKALGKSKLRPWDGYNPLTTLPLAIAPVDQQLRQTQKFFDELSPVLGGHFAHLRQQKLIALESRKHKQTNPFCTSFTDEGATAILCCSTGNAHDISTLVHESGHAFQNLESSDIDAVMLQCGSYELAEIPSTAMEYMLLDKAQDFFGKDNATKFRVEGLQGFIGLLDYVCVVDEYQHWVYEHPKASASERDGKWDELCRVYLPEFDYAGYEQYRTLRWYSQGHIFVAPFYYIDYALAETAAMQIAMINEHDHQKAMDIYMRVCQLGGQYAFLETLQKVGLRSPFDESLIKDLAEFVAQKLQLN